MTHADLVKHAETFLRTQRICWPVLTEPADMPEHPDAIGWGEGSRRVEVVECKRSREDWRKDMDKAHRRPHQRAMGTHLWVLCPAGLIESYEAEQRGMGLVWADDQGGLHEIVEAPARSFALRDAMGEYDLCLWALRRLSRASKIEANAARPREKERVSDARLDEVRAYLRTCEPGELVRVSELKRALGVKGMSADKLAQQLIAAEAPDLLIDTDGPTSVGLIQEPAAQGTA